MGNRQLIGGVGTIRRRIATGLIVATLLAVLLLAVGCKPEPAPCGEVVLAAGDIVSGA